MASSSSGGPAIADAFDGRSSRIFSLDVLRGIALLGILVVSIWEFGGFSNNQQTYYRTGTHGGNYALLSFVTIVFEGKMRALLALAFGAGIILFLSRKSHPSPLSTPDIYVRRHLWLLLFGIFNAIILLWPGDILFQYAVLGILLFPFWRMKPRHLMAAAIITTLIYCGKQYWNYADDRQIYKKFMAVSAAEKKFITADTVKKKAVDSLLQLQQRDPFSARWFNDGLMVRYRSDTLTSTQAKDKQAWEGLVKGLKYDSTADSNANKSMRTTNYARLWNYQLGKSQNRESWWLYRTGIWDIGSMMLLGMALLGLGFFHRQVSLARYIVIAVACIAIGLGLAWWRNHGTDLRLTDYAKYIDRHWLPANQFFPVERLLLAVGYASLLMIVIRIAFLQWLWRTMEAVGRMAISNYFLQTVLCTLFFYGYGMGFFGRFSQWQLYFVVVEIWMVEMAFSLIWLRFFMMGPVEWLWRWLAFGKKPLFRKVTGTTILRPGSVSA